jgi:hypothetical protein
VFNAGTRFDWYVLKNTKNENLLTTIKCQDGILHKLDISKLEFIPNGRFDDIMKLYSKENRVKLTHSFSLYESRKNHMSKKVNEEFKYPCVYTTQKDGSFKLWYSSTNEHGHFGLSKVIWSNGGASTPIVDYNGDYGLMEYSYAIIDDKDVLLDIQKAMLSPKFLELMTFSNGTTGIGLHRYNTKAISTFRKDFYKQFLND